MVSAKVLQSKICGEAHKVILVNRVLHSKANAESSTQIHQSIRWLRQNLEDSLPPLTISLPRE